MSGSGQPNVLVGNAISVRLLDLLDCGAKPDMIASGAPNVLIGNLPAARQMDVTMHAGGGVDPTGTPIGGHGSITQGFSKVLIGTRVSGKAARMMWRRALIAYARKIAEDTSNPALSEDAKLLEVYNRAADLMHLATEIYAYPHWSDAEWAAHGLANSYGDYRAPEGYEIVSEHERADIGFMARVYRSTFDGQYVLVYRGTDDGVELMNPNSLDNVNGNFPQVVGREAPQYAEAAELAKEIAAQTNGNLIITGHSLGGGLAAIASLASNIPAFTFDAAGLHPDTIERYGTEGTDANALIHALNLHGDFLTRVQTDESVDAAFPDAVGEGLEVPLNDEQEAAYGARLDDFAALLHDPWLLYKAIEAQKTKLIDSLCTSLNLPKFTG